jgi:hypothetical protein
MAVATAARADSGNARAAAYANPVLQFLASHSDPAALAATGVPRMNRRNAVRRGSEIFGAGAMDAMLAVEFVGLVVPLNLTRLRADSSNGCADSEPLLSALYQRPPPIAAL